MFVYTYKSKYYDLRVVKSHHTQLRFNIPIFLSLFSYSNLFIHELVFNQFLQYTNNFNRIPSQYRCSHDFIKKNS